MNERFERYNEITFEAYCKAAIAASAKKNAARNWSRP